MECRSIRREFLFPVLLVQCSWLTRDFGLRMQRSPRYARGLFYFFPLVFLADVGGRSGKKPPIRFVGDTSGTGLLSARLRKKRLRALID